MTKIRTNGKICAICCEDNFSTSFFQRGRVPTSNISQQLVIAVKLDKLPYSLHGVKIEVQVVHRVQHRRQDLIRHEKMAKVRSGIRLTHRAAAGIINRTRIILESGILDRNVTVPSE